MSSPSGILPRMHARLFGERDAVGEQLRDLARQGSAMARLAHACAFLLICLFSLGSLVALNADALNVVLGQWQRGGGLNIPSAISVAVGTLLVLAMDIAMLYAALMLRVLAARRAVAGDMWLHVVVLITVALLEAGTYAFMAYTYDRPATWPAWVLIIARAIAAPVLSVYLSLARTLPVTPRDILAQVELASGAGMIRDVVTIAADTDAPLASKAAVFGAAAVMTPADRARLDHLIAVVSEQQPMPAALPEPLALLPALSLADLIGTSPHEHDHDEDPHPTGPGSPSAQPSGDDSPVSEREEAAVSMPPLSLRGRRGKRTASARKASRIVARRASAFALLDDQPGMTRADLRQELRCRQSEADGYYAEWEATRRRERRQAR